MAARTPKLTRERVLDAALALVDDEGLDALSMRRVGAALGVEAMSLYHHVPSKAALLDGVHERVLLSVEEPPRSSSWRAYARHQALALQAALLRHPHAVPLFATRPAATPASIERLGRHLEVLERAGFTPARAIMLVQLTLQLVVGHVMWVTAPPAPVDYARAPAAVRRAARAPYDPDEELRRGLDALLAGFHP